VISVRTCGGGGYGPPEERDPERVLRDVLEEKIGADRARELYKVAIADRRIDEAATKTLRAKKARVGTTQSPRAPRNEARDGEKVLVQHKVS
jgi:N-methylhydantoinase B/oxoprolinase/acetone carboxylase alpha subunit